MTHSIWSVILLVFTLNDAQGILKKIKNQIDRYDLSIGGLTESVARRPSKTDHHHTSNNITKDSPINDFAL